MKLIPKKDLIAMLQRSSDYDLIDIEDFIASIQQEQPKGNLEYWLEHFGMPKENIDNCITQIAQGYGACRYLEGIQHGAEAVNELAKQVQPEVDLEKEITKWMEAGDITDTRFDDYGDSDIEITARHFYELGLNARKEE